MEGLLQIIMFFLIDFGFVRKRSQKLGYIVAIALIFSIKCVHGQAPNETTIEIGEFMDCRLKTVNS